MLFLKGNDGILGFDGVKGHSSFQFRPIALSSLEREKIDIVAASCGENHVVALATTGRVYTWGTGEQFQLGRRIIGRHRLNGLNPEKLALKNISLVSAGMYHSFAVDTSGVVWAWGLNTFHQTGLSPSKGGNNDEILQPAQVDALAPEKHNGSRVIQIEGGEHHTIFLFDNGEVWGCGRCDGSQIGLAKDHPAWRGVEEREEDIKEIKREKLREAQKKLDQVVGEEAIKEAEAAVAAADASLRAALDSFVPEPVRVCHIPICWPTSWILIKRL